MHSTIAKTERKQSKKILIFVELVANLLAIPVFKDSQKFNARLTEKTQKTQNALR